MKKKKLEKEKIEDADEGIYKDIYSDNWYDSQQIRDISLPDEHIGWCLFDSYKRKHLYKYEIIHVFPIERTLINRFFWSIFRLGDRLSKSERVKRFINSKRIGPSKLHQ